MHDLPSNYEEFTKRYELKGAIDAYWDLICLIRSRLGKEEKDDNTSKN
jgi:hypothetical protein